MSAPELRRFLLTLHYDGSAFHGWQVQPDQPTVQGEIEAVVERISGESRPVVGSGRTDAGVHATGQMATVDLPERWTAGRLRGALNALLPKSVWVEEVRPVHGGFHARYDAVARTYEYRVGTSPLARSPFSRPWCWPLGEPLDVALMQEASRALLGDRSFLAFAKAGQPERGDRCTVTSATWEPWEGLGVRFTITANRYLHHMVRYLVGTLVDVGRRRRPAATVETLLDDPDCGEVTSPPAPPEGLFLTRVEYPVESLEAPPESPKPESHPTP